MREYVRDFFINVSNIKAYIQNDYCYLFKQLGNPQMMCLETVQFSKSTDNYLTSWLHCAPMDLNQAVQKKKKSQLFFRQGMCLKLREGRNLFWNIAVTKKCGKVQHCD